jgi:hypothetical protein
VHTINGVRNRYGGAARAHPADPEFYGILERMRRIQNSGAMGMRVEKTSETEGILLTFRQKADPAIDDDMKAVRKSLGLDPAAQEFRIVYGAVARNDKEIAILSRSMLEIIVDFASYIDVPPDHVAEQRVNPTMPAETYANETVPPLMVIHSSAHKPKDSFIAIPYRKYWFWIDDRDLRSKSIFTFMMFMFSLTESNTGTGAPIVTIPAG